MWRRRVFQRTGMTGEARNEVREQRLANFHPPNVTLPLSLSLIFPPSLRRQSLLVLMKRKEDNFYLHIPVLFADIIDCKTIFKKKRLILKLFKRKNDPWPTLAKKPEPKKTDYDDDLDELETDEGKKTKFVSKASLPFGDDLDAYVDRAADGNIDIDSKATWE